MSGISIDSGEIFLIMLFVAFLALMLFAIFPLRGSDERRLRKEVQSNTMMKKRESVSNPILELQKYIPQISEQVNSLSPQLSEAWHADEVFVKMRNGVDYRKKQEDRFSLERYG